MRAEPSSLLLRKEVTVGVRKELQGTLYSSLASGGAFVGQAAVRYTAQIEAVVNPSHAELDIKDRQLYLSYLHL